MSQRPLRIVLGVFLILIGVSAWWMWNRTHPYATPAGPVETVTVAEASQPVFALVYVAEALGYFADAGVEVKFLSFSSGRDALQSVVEGRADLATTYETPVILQTFAGEQLSVVSGLHSSAENTALVARRDRGITAPSDLRGKTIGVTRDTNGEFFLYLLLTSNGISLEEVSLVDVRPGEMATMLVLGTVDAVATWNPHAYNAERDLAGGAVTFLSDSYAELSVLAGRRTVVAQRGEAIERLLTALVWAEEFVASDPEAARALVARRLSSYSSKTIEDTWDAFTRSVAIDGTLLTTLQQEAQWFSDSGIVDTAVPDFRTVIFSEYLKAISPENVNIR